MCMLTSSERCTWETGVGRLHNGVDSGEGGQQSKAARQSDAVERGEHKRDRPRCCRRVDLQLGGDQQRLQNMH